MTRMATATDLIDTLDACFRSPTTDPITARTVRCALSNHGQYRVIPWSERSQTRSGVLSPSRMSAQLLLVASIISVLTYLVDVVPGLQSNAPRRNTLVVLSYLTLLLLVIEFAL